MEHSNDSAGGDKPMTSQWPQLPHRGPVAGDYERLSLVQSPHDSAAVIAQFALCDFLCHTATVAHHATGSYAELDREDPVRKVAASSSFLQASLFTSVLAFGVAVLAVGLGVVFILIGFALRSIAGTMESREVVRIMPGGSEPAGAARPA